MTQAARIGPNAILQLIPLLDAALGETARRDLFCAAKVPIPPPDAGMLPENQVIRLHHAVVLQHPVLAPDLLRAAGEATADYILAHRIPKPVQLVIRALPAAFATRVLAQAILRHAWTFAGSGQFRINGYQPLCFEIAQNPLAVGPTCHWHAAVFARLFARLVTSRALASECACCAAGHAACRFEISL